MTTNIMSAVTKNLNDYTGLIGVVIAAILGLQVATDDNSDNITKLQTDFQLNVQQLRHEVATVLKSVEEVREDSQELARQAAIDLWIERARRAPSLAELPAFPRN